METTIEQDMTTGPTRTVYVSAARRTIALTAAEEYVGDFPCNSIEAIDKGYWAVTFDAGHFA